MKDRLPGAPGRYEATISAEELKKMQNEESFVITMKRADQPIVEGTPYNKDSVLPDDVAAELNLGIDDPTPADAFRKIGKDINNTPSNIYPVGSQYIASSPDVNPADLFGGTWELVDKGFKHKVEIKTFDKDIGEEGYYGADGYVTRYAINAMDKMEIYYHLAGNTVRFRISMYLKAGATFDDIGVSHMILLHPTDFGFTQFSASFHDIACYNDTFNSVGLVMTVSYDGQIKQTDVVGTSRTLTIPANCDEAVSIDITTPINKEYMLDDFCDKFYWKRTA